MALGAFLAGLLLADSEYRHELESQIEPFKGLLLGLFFISVGMGANLSLLLSTPLVVIGLTLLLIGLKLPLLYAVGRMVGDLNRESALRLGVVLAAGVSSPSWCSRSVATRACSNRSCTTCWCSPSPCPWP